jgi:alpha-tubulin suppressor-like RCC1 family protein
MIRRGAASLVLLLVAGWFAPPASAAGSWHVSVKPTAQTITLGQTVKLTGKIVENAVGQRVILERKKGSSWVTMARATVTKARTFTFKWKPGATGRSVLRVVKPASNGYLKGVSNQSFLSVTTWQDVSISTKSGCGVRSDASLWCWGQNNGPYDLQVTWSRPTAMELTNTKTGLPVGGRWANIDVDAGHGCGIKTTGALHCWGDNTYGQVGIGRRTAWYYTLDPVDAVGTWLSVNVGKEHSCAIRADHTLWCWGRDTSGQAGVPGASGDVLSPTQVGTLDDWVVVSADRDTTCGVHQSGALDCWGAIGDEVPAAVSTETPLKSVRAGFSPCGIDVNGHLACLPYAPQSTNLVVADTTVTFTDLDIAGQYRCGIDVDHRLYCWTRNEESADAPETPVQVGTQQDWASVDVAEPGSACALALSGQRFCWGSNTETQAGDGSITSAFSPAAAASTKVWRTLAVGTRHACAIDLDDHLSCWGDNAQGGIDPAAPSITPAPRAILPGSVWKSVAETADRTCAVRMDGALYCSQFGVPFAQEAGALDWKQIEGGTNGFCGIRGAGSLWCGTSGSFQQIGTATNWSSVAVGANHRCAINSGRALYCWGSNTWGQLGLGSNAPVSEPTRVGSASNWTRVSAGTTHTCGVDSAGRLFCWGGGSSGEIGLGDQATATTPTRVGTATDWASVDAGLDHSCGTRTSGQLWCWGRVQQGQVGIMAPGASTPQRVGTSAWKTVSAGAQYSCGLSNTGKLWCWGEGSNGQLATGAVFYRDLPAHLF